MSFDRSGVVRLPQTVPPTGTWSRARTWEDLTPFAQGYVEALFTSLRKGDIGHWPDALARKIGFKDLAPEALAMILRDCKNAEGWLCQGNMAARGLIASEGGRFWSERQRGEWMDKPEYVRYAPLRIYLNDAGKVMLAEI